MKLIFDSLKRFFIVLFFLSGSVTMAQSKTDATAPLVVLEERVALSHGVMARYNFTALDPAGTVLESFEGEIQMLQQSFLLTTPYIRVWYNGETLWSLLISGEEVTITAPEVEEIKSINPFELLRSYKEGYAASLLAATKPNQKVIVLTPQEVGGDISQVVVTLDAKSNAPICMEQVNSDKSRYRVVISDFSTNERYNKGCFSFNQSDYPTVEIIDLR